jgi:hypothetical protein
MSTKMSTDLNVTRPSTRLHAPPGGATTISFGSEAPPLPPATETPAKKPAAGNVIFDLFVAD